MNLTKTVAASEEEPAADAVIFVVLDGVRWQEVFLGVDPALAREHGLPVRAVVAADKLMPSLHGILASRGVALGAPDGGPEMRASGPNYVSLPGYTEILTGRTASACHDNDCQQTSVATIADEIGKGGVTGSAAVISSWESLERAASSGAGEVIVSAGRHHGKGLDALRVDPEQGRWLTKGSLADRAPGEADFRPDRLTAELALAYLRTRAPRFLFVGLGEPDEYAHQNNYAGYLDSLRAADRVLGRIMVTLRTMGERGRRTAVFVTTDHGRAASFKDHGGFAPESGRVWLVAAGAGIRESGNVAAATPHRLADLAPTARCLLGLPADEDRAAGRVLGEALISPEACAASRPQAASTTAVASR